MRQLIGIIIAMGMAGMAGMFIGIELIGRVIAALMVLSKTCRVVSGRLYNRYGGHHSDRFYRTQLNDLA